MKSFIAALLLALPALSQQFSITGTVANSKTGEPIPRALVTAGRLVTLEGPSRTDFSKPFPSGGTAFTDAGGRFQITGLSEGEYTISAKKPEFTVVEADRNELSSAIQLKSSVNNVQLKLAPLGVITGTITDQDGLPLPGISVLGLSSQITDGIRHIKSDRTATTDDRGVYRFWNLAPGQYYLKAASPNSESEFVGSATPGTGDESFFPRLLRRRPHGRHSRAHRDNPRQRSPR